MNQPSTTSSVAEKSGGEQRLHLVLISVHGLIRGQNLELGRDADTGGQTRYIVELARELGKHPDIARLDLLTRRVPDPAVSAEYGRHEEVLSDGVRIIRLDCGEEAYVPKEQLWDSLDVFADNALQWLREHNLRPDIVHSHYADAGYVGIRLSSQLGVPLVHTGHSLGRVKRRRLLARGLRRDFIEQRYNMSRRIEVEEDILAAAELVITSTNQEIEQQYGLYDHYQQEIMRVIPPGVELDNFHPSDGTERDNAIYRELGRFLLNPDRPIILALSRPDTRKNIISLLEAYGESGELQATANLVIIAGNREDIRDLDNEAQEVLTEILLTIDQYNLYGKVAYPKSHRPDDVPVLYRLAAISQGVFINPALTEPFGLTLIEAAASGLPVVATEDGGPRDITANCQNGYLIDPLDKQDIIKTLLKILSDANTWRELSRRGLQGVKQHYSWQAHTQVYVSALHALLASIKTTPPITLRRRAGLYHDRAIFTDLDQSLLGDAGSLTDFLDVMKIYHMCTTFGIATGRRLDSALRIMKRYGIPQPDILITSLGTEICYAPRLTRDSAWPEHIDHLWKPRAIIRALSDLPGIELQPRMELSRFKISYYIDPEQAPGLDEINSLLHQQEVTANTFLSFGQFLDIVPVRASKGFALRWYADQWDIPLENILVAGGSGADEDMMRGNTMAVVVANRHHEELSGLEDFENIYFARQPCASGILEAIEHYNFLGNCDLPGS